MSRYWSGLIPAAVVAATAALSAQGQNPANTPPADAGSPAGVQRTTPSPSAQARTDTITITGCLQNAPMASATTGANRGATGGNATGNTGNTGNATGSTAGSTAGNTGNATGNTAGNTGNAGRTAGNSGNAGATGQAASGRQFVLNGATMSAAGNASSGAVGTAGTAGTSYMLQGEAATLSPHLNRRVEITGTLQASSASATGAANARTGATASGQTLRVDSVRMLAETCDAGRGTTATPSSTTPQQQR
jgi:hypothetical protein